MKYCSVDAIFPLALYTRKHTSALVYVNVSVAEFVNKNLRNGTMRLIFVKKWVYIVFNILDYR